MYSQYVNNNFSDFFRPVSDSTQPPPHPVYVDVEAAHGSKPSSHGGGLLSGVKIPELDMETMAIMVLVYFLISEDGDSISDTLLIIGVLLILGF